MEVRNPPYLQNICEYLIDEYQDSLAQNEKSDFYNDDKLFSEKKISLTRSESLNFIKKYNTIYLKIKYFPYKKNNNKKRPKHFIYNTFKNK